MIHRLSADLLILLLEGVCQFVREQSLTRSGIGPDRIPIELTDEEARRLA